MTININKYENIEWNLPLLFQGDIVWGAIYKKIIASGLNSPKVNLYGTPLHRWIGGTIPRVKEKLQKNVLYEHFNYVSEIGATPILDFSSTNISKDSLKDEYENYLLDIALEHNASFIVYSDLLKDYIKEKNPNTKIISSVTKPIYRFQGPNRIEDPTIENETNYYNQLLKEYDIVIVRPEYSKYILVDNPNLIDDLSRIEMLINQPCVKNCPKMPEHFGHLQNTNVIPNYFAQFECTRTNMPPNVLYENNLIHDNKTIQKLNAIGVNKIMLILRQIDVPPIAAFDTMEAMFNTDGNNNIIFNEIISFSIKGEIAYYNSRIEKLLNKNNSQ